MGKRARKTRWRALDIADDHSDSEESNTNSSVVSSRYSRSNSNGYYSKYSYSSQSTPARRRYTQYDGSSKSTRSSSTTSENKIVFNEDEYTRITTPRQDVLFKKGYLNKPRSYQAQTSTGNSTVSTGNSTENGTPDHQSTDLDYESQFVFPNGFVDQNGIYYVNSYEPYPLMLFNPPTYYHEFTNVKAKRYSTGSLSESMSPNNEEVTSQDLSQSGGEASNSGVSDHGGAPPVFNMVYPGYYVNGACTPTDLANDQHNLAEPVKKLKKRRERKSSKTIPGDSSEYTDENSSDERNEDSRVRCAQTAASGAEVSPEAQSGETRAEAAENADETHKTATNNSHDHDPLPNGRDDEKTEPIEAQPKTDSQKPSVLKPDAEEFVPRAYQTLGPHIKMIPPNFMPIPLVPISDFGAQNFAPAFIPPGIPINFIPHPKMFPPPAPGFVSFTPPVVHEAKIEEMDDPDEDKFATNSGKDREKAAAPAHTPVLVEGGKAQVHLSKTIDIATVVSKLEAVKQQEKQDTSGENVAKTAMNEGKPLRNASRPRNYYNNYRNSPVRNGYATGHSQNSPQHYRQPSAPVRHIEVLQKPALANGVEDPAHTTSNYSKQTRNSPEKFQKRNWKPNGYQNVYKNNSYRSPKRIMTNGHQSSPENVLVNNRSSHESAGKVQDAPHQNIDQKSTPSKIEPVKPKPHNQWIPVSSRKKKKNKALEEDVDTDVNDDVLNNSADLFESYDVTQLVDVVPVADEKKIEHILTSIAQSEAIIEVPVKSPTNIPEVSYIEKNIIDKIEGEAEETTLVKEDVVKEEEEEEGGGNKPTNDNAEEEKEEACKPKKRSKKGTQKPLTKKVIITDIFSDLSVTSLETKSPSKPPAKTIEETKPIVKDDAKEEVETDLPEKKPKKKKKNKNTKPTCDNNKPITNEVLLESTFAPESPEKTNDEISEELDKLIQRGMYSSLQEKIKSINVEPDDGFFKTYGSALTPLKDKSGAALKTPDFNRIFQSTRQFLKPNMTLPIRALDLF